MSNTFNEMRYLRTLKEIKKKKRLLSEYEHGIKAHVKCFVRLFLVNVLNVLHLLHICTFNKQACTLLFHIHVRTVHRAHAFL